MSIPIDKGWQYLLYFVDCLVSLHEFLERRGHRFTVTYLNVTRLVNRCVIFLPNFLFNRSKYDVCMDGWVLLYFCDTWHRVLGRLPASSRPRQLGFKTLGSTTSFFRALQWYCQTVQWHFGNTAKVFGHLTFLSSQNVLIPNRLCPKVFIHL